MFSARCSCPSKRMHALARSHAHTAVIQRRRSHKDMNIKSHQASPIKMLLRLLLLYQCTTDNNRLATAHRLRLIYFYYFSA